MSELKRRRKKKDALENEGESTEPTKEETAIAKHLRWNCPTKSSTMMANKVEYFMGSKAVDCLLDSNWASGKGKTEIIFTTRESCVLYLDRLLSLGMFSRVVRIKKRKGEKERAKEKSEDGEGKKKKEKKEKERKEKGDDPKKEAEGKSEEVKKKRKVKVKLEIHDEQTFYDGDDEAYAWIYDPVHPRTFVMGILVVIATIAICMFPLWPSNVREYVWYISVIAAAGIGMILILAVLRYFIFGILWAISGGRHKFWLLPNLTEECGFFESFAPLYTYEYNGKDSSKQDTDTDKKDDVGKEEGDEQEQETGNGTENTTKGESSEEKETDGERDSWVKVTDEDVENAKSNMEEDESMLTPQDELTNENTMKDNETEKAEDATEETPDASEPVDS